MNKSVMNVKNRSFLPLLIIISVFAVCFVAGMGYLNYRSTAIALEEQVIARIEDDTVADLETAISFGKSFETFYGMEEIFAAFSAQIDNTHPFIISKEGMLLLLLPRNINKFVLEGVIVSTFTLTFLKRQF